MYMSSISDRVRGSLMLRRRSSRRITSRRIRKRRTMITRVRIRSGRREVDVEMCRVSTRAFSGGTRTGRPTDGYGHVSHFESFNWSRAAPGLYFATCDESAPFSLKTGPPHQSGLNANLFLNQFSMRRAKLWSRGRHGNDRAGRGVRSPTCYI